MRKIIFILLLSAVSANIKSQDKFNFSRHSLKECTDFETAQNAAFVDTIIFGILKTHSKNKLDIKNTKTLIFKRANNDFNLPLHVWYHIDPASNSLEGVRYYWGLYNPAFTPKGNEQLLIGLSKSEKQFQEKFDVVHQLLKAQMGKESGEETIVDSPSTLIKNVYWENKSQRVELSIAFSRVLKPIGNEGFLYSKFEIEVMITYKDRSN